MTQHRKWLFGPEKTAFAKRDVVERVALSGRSYKHEFEPSEIERKLAAIFEHGADVFNLKHGREIIDPRTYILIGYRRFLVFPQDTPKKPWCFAISKTALDLANWLETKTPKPSMPS